VANPEHFALLRQGPHTWNARRPERPDLGGADLDGGSLRGANLGGANLGGANLGGVDLRGANLGGVDLRGANLTDAELGGAELRGAHLGGAYLSGAQMYGANLCRADLGGVDLRGADLTDAILTGAYWDAATRWPEGFTPPVSTVAPFRRVERLAPAAADEVRAGTEELIRLVSELLDDTSALSRELPLDPAQLADVERYRRILFEALRDPEPESVIIARAVARLAAIVAPTEADAPALTEAYAEAGVPEPEAAAAAVIDVAEQVTRLGAEDAEDDRSPVEALRQDMDELERLGAELVDDDERVPLSASARVGVDKYLTDELSGTIKAWVDPQVVFRLVRYAMGATGAARFGPALVQYATAALHHIFPNILP
jgi:hypothetical protein